MCRRCAGWVRVSTCDIQHQMNATRRPATRCHPVDGASATDEWRRCAAVRSAVQDRRRIAYRGDNELGWRESCLLTPSTENAGVDNDGL